MVDLSMENEIEIYSNDVFASNLKDLVDNSSYTPNEIAKKMEYYYGSSISGKQLKRYMNGTAIPKADTLCLLAIYFDVSIDALLGRCDIDRIYINDNDNPNFNKFHLNFDSRYILSKIDNDTKINVLNKIISKSNLLDVFTAQIGNVTAQLKDVTDKEIKDNIIFDCSCSIQREIYNIFKKCVNDYLKRK